MRGRSSWSSLKVRTGVATNAWHLHFAFHIYISHPPDLDWPQPGPKASQGTYFFPFVPVPFTGSLRMRILVYLFQPRILLYN